jgi:hypothetical protein
LQINDTSYKIGGALAGIGALLVIIGATLLVIWAARYARLQLASGESPSRPGGKPVAQ